MKRKTQVSYSEMQAILEETAQGIEITDICKKYGIHLFHFKKQLMNDSLFISEFNMARSVAAEALVAKLLTIGEDVNNGGDTASAKIKSDNIKWIASKHAREIYGEKMDVAVHQTLDLSKVLEAANARVIPMLHKEQMQLPVISATYTEIATGLEPVAENAAPNSELNFQDLL